MSDGTPSTNPPGRKILSILGLLMLAGMVAAVVYLGPVPRQPVDPSENVDAEPVPFDGQPSIHTATECREINALMRKSLGALENFEHKSQSVSREEVSRVFDELVRRLPHEPAVARNRAVFRLMWYADQKKNPRITTEEVDAAIKLCQRLEPKSPVPFLLESKLKAILINQSGTDRERIEQETMNALTRASELNPDDPAIWYEIHETAKLSRNPDIKAQARPALKQAFELEPTNLRLAIDYLLIQVESQDPKIVENFKSIREIAAPLFAGVSGRSSVDLNAEIEQAVLAVGEKNWPEVKRVAYRLGNLLVSEEWVKTDVAYLKSPLPKAYRGHHPLVYSLGRFQNPVCDEASLDQSAVDFGVKLAAAEGAGKLPELANVVDVALADFDLDGLFDVIALTPREIVVFRRSGRDSPWEVSSRAAVPEGALGLVLGDLDRDFNAMRAGVPRDADASCQEGDVDLIVFGTGGVVALENKFDAEMGTRALVATEQLPQFAEMGGVTAGAVVDLDCDGDLDLALATDSGIRLWSCRSSMLQYDDVTTRSSIPAELRATSLIPVDWERDIDQDLILVGMIDDRPVAGMLQNQRHLQFRWRAFEGELSKLAAHRRLALADFDNNVSWDLFGAGPEGVALTRTASVAGEPVTGRDVSSLSKTAAEAIAAYDLDNDSRLDLVAVGPLGAAVFTGTSDTGLTSVAPFAAPLASALNSVAVADLDNDGDGDVVVAGSAGPVLLVNDGGNRNHHLRIRIRGAEDNLSTKHNHLGIGATIEVRHGTTYQIRSVTGQATDFGLGPDAEVADVRVIWLGGVPQWRMEAQADQPICEDRVLSGSCPFIYTWDGERFVFLTDGLWNAPLGLRYPDGSYVQPRPWEYLLIPGERLKPRDGQYVIQFTEEVWEATYLDQMQLVAIDHPDDVSVYSNEKVGPAEISEFQIHTVRQPRLPKRAQNQHGRDALADIASQDGVFWRGFDSHICQGLVTEHHLELDLGELKNPERVTLYLTGWMHPADTSLHLAMGQNPKIPAMKPPALSVPDGDGNWRVVRPFIGFPGGKTKTIAVDLSGAFLTEDYRLRIATNFELYWDSVFFTVDEEGAETKVTRLDPSSADLHGRGISAVRKRDHHAPDFFDYDNLVTEPRWPPMRGYFTRYGDVTELVRATDDCHVVLGAGDEVTVTFDALPDPPPGWKRDYFLYNVGWDKDCNLNTVSSQQVEPLPFQSMTAYPYSPGEVFPDTPATRDYLSRYQTRVQDLSRFWQHWRGGTE